MFKFGVQCRCNMPTSLQYYPDTEVSAVFHSMAKEEIFRPIEGNKKGAYEDNTGTLEFMIANFAINVQFFHHRVEICLCRK